MREFAKAVQELARNDQLTRQVLRAKLVETADATLAQAKVSMAALARAWLIEHPNQARAILAKLVELPLASDGEHPVTAALNVLRGLYAGSSRELPPVAHIDLGRHWREAIDAEDRRKALNAFEWATLFKLRVALRNGSVHLAKREESLAGVSSALSLLCNIVMAWNAEGMQAALNRIRADGQDLRRIAPTNVEGINLRGTLDFAVEKYAERILPSTASVASRLAGARTAGKSG